MTDIIFYGYSNRIIPINKIPNQIINKISKTDYQIIDAIKDNQCQRCMSKYIEKSEYFSYCRQCISLGRLSTDDKLIIFKDLNDLVFPLTKMSWNGQLSSLQQKISDELKNEIFNYKSHLLWAVTGAGKTEILFQTVEKILNNNMRIALVSPRIDVCLELYPRFQSAFKDISITLMHGQKEDKLEFSQFIIATVHQLLKFRNAFDVIIIDEVDSYPLEGNEFLKIAIKNALKNNGIIVNLSATPSKKLKREVEKKYYLTRRFHGKPLPVPETKFIFSSKNDYSRKVEKHVVNLLLKKQRFLLFFPSIKSLNQFFNKFNMRYPNFKVRAVSSISNDRIQIINEFRNGNYSALFTTTILERGVTFNNIDVIVFKSDHKNFSKEILIQIAGRAGRQKEHFNNKVTFYYSTYKRKIRDAISEIEELNNGEF